MSSQLEEHEFDLFQDVDEKALAGANFTAEVIGELRRAFNALHDTSGLTQKEISDRLGVSKSAVHRWLYGDGNMTIRKLGELVWAMDCRTAFKLTADLREDTHEAVDGQASHSVALVSVEATPAVCDVAKQWYHLTPLHERDVKSLTTTRPLSHVDLTGYLDSTFIHGSIFSIGRNQAIASFGTIEVENGIDRAVSFIDSKLLPARSGSGQAKSLRFDTGAKALGSSPGTSKNCLKLEIVA